MAGRKQEKQQALVSIRDTRGVLELGGAATLSTGAPAVVSGEQVRSNGQALPPSAPPLDLAKLTNQILLESYAPAAVVIDQHNQIVHSCGPIMRFLDQPTGTQAQDLLRLAQGGLRTRLRNAILTVRREGQRVTVPHVRLKRDGAPVWIRVTVQPIDSARAAEGLLLVIFQDWAEVPTSLPRTGAAQDLIRQFQTELRSTRDDLQATIEKLGIVNEELMASNEEITSMNEELQSSNEELKSSREKLQSLNEKLSTANTELEKKITELGQARTSLETRVQERTAELETINRQLRDEIAERHALERQVLEVAAAEQRRIGQDLHDDLGQQLTGLCLMAQSLLEAVPNRDLPQDRIAGKIAVGLRRALKRVRILSRGLVPVEVDAEGLMAALTELTGRVSELTGVACTFECAQPAFVEDNNTATHLYHIAQEAVTNALKHGKVDDIEVGLCSDEHSLTLSVRDDGVGMPKFPEESGGLGLKIMRYRAGLINATLHVGAAEQGGTLVTCTLSKDKKP
jgi:signal transduction histidine kinase